MHYVTTVFTIPLCNLVPLYWKNSQPLGTNCSLEKQWFQIIPFVTNTLDRLLYCYLCESLEEILRIYIDRQKLSRYYLLHWLQTKIKATVPYLLTTELYFPHSTVDILCNIYNWFSLLSSHAQINKLINTAWVNYV